MTTPSIPATMRAVVLHNTATREWHIEDRPVPQPGRGDVLVKIAAAPLNPSDLSFMSGNYGVRKSLPVIPGFESGGRIVAVGDEVDPSMIGQKVAAFAGGGDGTYAEYLRTSAMSCLPVADHISEEAAAMMLVNPITAAALVQIALDAGVKAVVQTAAASALGQMVDRYGSKHGLAVINIVRRPAQADDLRAKGAAHVLDTSDANFDSDLRNWCRSFDARVGFDAVGGALTDRVLRGMPNESRLIIYGGLEGQPVSIGVDQFVFRNKQIGGFWLTTWMREQPMAMIAAWNAVQESSDDFKSDVRGRYPIDQFGEALAAYEAQMSGGKILIVP